LGNNSLYYNIQSDVKLFPKSIVKELNNSNLNNNSFFLLRKLKNIPRFFEFDTSNKKSMIWLSSRDKSLNLFASDRIEIIDFSILFNSSRLIRDLVWQMILKN